MATISSLVNQRVGNRSPDVELSVQAVTNCAVDDDIDGWRQDPQIQLLCPPQSGAH